MRAVIDGHARLRARGLPVSLENVERLRAYLEPWSGVVWDRDVLSKWLTREHPLIDSDVTYQDAVMFDNETFHGRDGLKESFERWLESFAEVSMDFVEIVGDGDSLVSIHQWKATARHTGIKFEGRSAYLWRFENGKVVRFQSFPDPDQALKAGALAE
jgi:ketosteroid isomerase-like protein